MRGWPYSSAPSASRVVPSVYDIFPFEWGAFQVSFGESLISEPGGSSCHIEVSIGGSFLRERACISFTYEFFFSIALAPVPAVSTATSFPSCALSAGVPRAFFPYAGASLNRLVSTKVTYTFGTFAATGNTVGP